MSKYEKFVAILSTCIFVFSKVKCGFFTFYVGIYSHQCVITDARHDSSRAAMHSTVSRLEYCIRISEVLLPMLQYHLLSPLIVATFHFIFSNKKVIAVCNWSRKNERSAPSREVPMTKEMITNLIENQGCLTCFTMSLVNHNLCVWYGRVAGN